jgi:demethylmenaquinone methyltransferase / 2-methoxy-6-polyprenyl-1,4-benzoquinol methylase
VTSNKPNRMSEATPAKSQGSPLGQPGNEEATARAVRGMFERVAPRYDFLNHLLSLRRDVAWRRATARALREVLARPGSLAADICCGTGDLALEFSRYSAGGILGTDFCHPMLISARRKTARAGRGISFFESDALRLPFREGSLDLIAVAFGFRNLSNYQRGLEEMRRVLKPGGTVAILEFSRVAWPIVGPLFRFYFRRVLPRIGALISGVSGPYQYLPDSVERFPDQKELAALMRAAGFGNVRHRNFFAGAAALHQGEK